VVRKMKISEHISTKEEAIKGPHTYLGLLYIKATADRTVEETMTHIACLCQKVSRSAFPRIHLSNSLILPIWNENANETDLAFLSSPLYITAWVPFPLKTYFTRVPNLSPLIQEEDVKTAFLNSDQPKDQPLGFKIVVFGGKNRSLYMESFSPRPWAPLLGPVYYSFKGIAYSPSPDLASSPHEPHIYLSTYKGKYEGQDWLKYIKEAIAPVVGQVPLEDITLVSIYNNMFKAAIVLMSEEQLASIKELGPKRGIKIGNAPLPPPSPLKVPLPLPSPFPMSTGTTTRDSTQCPRRTRKPPSTRSSADSMIWSSPWPNPPSPGPKRIWRYSKETSAALSRSSTPSASRAQITPPSWTSLRWPTRPSTLDSNSSNNKPWRRKRSVRLRRKQ
jgi:hypothetical protein